ncbi:hypothetical protein C8R43DRAFT_1039169 [Mycena crocata]|nr:hypothetical protein C8R43DRAFT_1039169 [Mycena crocata]
MRLRFCFPAPTYISTKASLLAGMDGHAFFPYANNFTIHGGNFISARHYRAIQELPAHSGLELPSASLPINDDTDIFPTKQLICGRGYRLHEAQLGSRAVVVKVFSGPRALEDWDAETTPSGNCMHPNFLHAMGRSSEATPDPYIIYHGGAEDPAERMLASILRRELSRCLFLALTMVQGISAALSYLQSKEYPLEHAKCMDFDLLVGGDGDIRICMNTSPSPQRENLRMSKLHLNSSLDLFDDLCRRTFVNANRLLYCDNVDRCAIVYPDTPPPRHQIASNFGNKDESNLQLATSTFPPPDAAISGTGRRELVWKTSEKNADLSAISQQVGNFLFRLRSSGSGGLRCFPAHDQGQTRHRCPGYSREEIILGAQPQNSGILLYTTPRPREMCTVCGNTVEFGGWFGCKCGKDEGAEPSFKCAACCLWHHVGCPCKARRRALWYRCPRSKCVQVFTSSSRLREHCSRTHSLPCPCGLSLREHTIDGLGLHHCGFHDLLRLDTHNLSSHRYRRQDQTDSDSKRVRGRFLNLRSVLKVIHGTIIP